MSSNVRNILLNLIAAVILALIAYTLSLLFPDMDDNLRLVIAGLAAIVGLLSWHYGISPRFKMFTQWLVQKWRYVVIVILLIVIEVLLYLAYADWRNVVFSLAHFALIAVAAWLLVRYPKPYTYEPSHEEFREDFRHGLENWEYHHEEKWRTEREGDGCILIVTESPSGGIAKPCLSWRDYVFEFETKIVNGNTSWIIRAQDTDNYVMLQCQEGQLYPHFRMEGRWERVASWTRKNPVLLPFSLPLNTWFGVRIEVRGTQVLVTVTVNDRETEILNSSALLEPPIAPASYTMGSVGFRESARECAHFRNVHVKRLF
jgi:hypothetical protein